MLKRKTVAILLACFLLALCFSSCAKKEVEYVVLSEPLAEEAFCIGFRKEDNALCQAVEEALVEMKEDGTLSEIDKKWFGKDVSIVDAANITQNASDDSLQKILDKGQLVLGLDDSFPPMGYRDNENAIVGYDIDLATEVCQRLGVELVLQPISWTAKEKEINSGNIDCIWNGFSTNPEREEQLCMSMPYLNNRQVIVTTQELYDDGLDSTQALAGRTLVLQGGSTAVDALSQFPELSASLEGGAAVEVDTYVLAMFDLSSGGADAVLMDEVVANYYIANPAEQE